MKKLILASLCGLASAHVFSAEISEERIQFLESQLLKIQAELNEHKLAQQEIKSQHQEQQQLQAKESKSMSQLLDNVDVYGLIRLDGAVDFKSTPEARGRTINQINKVPFKEADSTRSDFTAAASRIGF